jgi:hypothetical protein
MVKPTAQRLQDSISFYGNVFDYCRKTGAERANFCTPDFSKFRFKLGTAVIDTRIPFFFTGDVRRTCQRAVQDLATLLILANKALIEPAKYDSYLLTLENIQLAAGEAHYDISAFKPGSITYKIVERSIMYDNLLNADLLQRWYDANGSGRALFAALSPTIQKALKESRTVTTGEDTLGLVIFSFVNLFRQLLAETFSKIDLGSVNSRLIVAAASALGGIFGAVIDEILISASLDKVPIDSASFAHAARLLSNPVNLVGEEHYSQLCLNLTGLSPEMFAALDREHGNILERNMPLENIREIIVAKTNLDGDQLKSWVTQWQRSSIKEEIIIALLGMPYKSDGALAGPAAQLIEINRTPQSLDNLIANPKLGKGLIDMMKGQAESAYAGQPLGATLLRISNKLKELSEFSLGRFGGKDKKQMLAEEAADRFLAFKLFKMTASDVSRGVNIFQEKLEDGEGVAEIWKDYDAGRIYRLAADDKPLLHFLELSNQAHLFMDLKDFTKRTYTAKEVKMADFMMNEFYVPVLAAAKEYHTGMVHLTDRGQIILNNLIGDAISFSGGITAIVRLARDIDKLLSNYSEKLKDKVPQEVVKKKLDELKLKHAEQYSGFKAQRDRYQAQVTKMTEAGNASPQQIARIQTEVENLNGLMAELNHEHENRRAALEGMGIDSGIFVSYGRSAEYQTIKDDVWGNWNVAIAEKINESARGTDRNGAVLRRLNANLNRERQIRKDERLQYPNRVFIDRAYSFRVPIEMETEFQTSIDNRDGDAGRKFFGSMATYYLGDFTRNILSGDGSSLDSIGIDNAIYNNGFALSGETLDAYLKIVGQEKRVKQITVSSADLNPEIVSRFIFHRDPLQFIFCYDDVAGQELPEIFLHVGVITFKGFESAEPLPTYEYLDPDSKFVELLLQHHIENWQQAADAYTPD